MPIRVKCGGCKKTLSVKDHLAGKKIKCPVCQTVVLVSASAPPKADPPAAAAASNPAAPPKKPGAAPKPGIAVKPPPDKSKSNGTPPPPDRSKSNGVPAPPAPIELPPENVEEEALAAFSDEPPPPVEETAEPQFIEFKCDWCDENVKLPMELAGKQGQCPNPECKRIVKVPLPKKVEKKDWRKMDRRGPAAALVNQPEQLDDAWGTQDATRARQDSLKAAGVIVEPVKRPVGAIGWMFRAFYGLCALALLVGLGVFGASRYSKKQQHNAREEAQNLVSAKDAKIKQLLLAAEAHRTIALLYLREGKPRKAEDHFKSAQVLADRELDNPKNAGINEQLFLIELALSQIELGGDKDEILAKTKLEWEEVRAVLAATLEKIRDPDVQAMALRVVGTRLFEKKQAEIAIGLCANLSVPNAQKKLPAPFRQQIALRFVMPDGEAKLKDITKKPDLNDSKDLTDAHARVGFAEGYARNGDFEAALKLANMRGPVKDKLDAFLGVAAVAWQRKNKEPANECLTGAILLAKDPNVSDWQRLQLVQLTARVERIDDVKDLVKFKRKPFELRAQLEIFLALCERSTGEVNADALQELEKADTEGTTLALAWMALARHNAARGGSRDRNLAIFEERVLGSSLTGDVLEKIRPMIDIGSYLGSVK